MTNKTKTMYTLTHQIIANSKCRIGKSSEDHENEDISTSVAKSKAVPALYMKKIEVCCMNRTYRGVGFYNDNGGLEFYSNDFKDKYQNSIKECIRNLEAYRETVREELYNLNFEIVRGEYGMTLWMKEYETLRKKYSGQSDMVGDEPKSPDTKKGFNKKQIRIRMCMLKNEIDGYRENVRRKNDLQYLVELTDVELQDKNKSMESVRTFTVMTPGLLSVSWIRGLKSEGCCLFADIFDYLAYVYLSCGDLSDSLPTCCDAIILNNASNFKDMAVMAAGYRKVFCFFPNNLFGQTMAKTIASETQQQVSNMEHFYGKAYSLYGYASRFRDFELKFAP